MHVYLIELGAIPELSEAELRALVQEEATFDRTGQTMTITTQEPLDVQSIVARAGGLMTISEKIGSLPGDQPTWLAEYLLNVVPEGKITFGLSGMSDKVGIQTKKLIKQEGRSVRFVSVKNTAAIIHNKLEETGTHIRQFNGYLYVTRGVHDFETMFARDEERPAVDSRSGMLPPKLARMMINLSGVSMDGTVLDPYCGSGTVLMEAMHIGIKHILGSDISEKAVKDTNTNVSWLAGRLGYEGHPEVRVLDVRAMQSAYEAESLDAIVAEPYMGQPKKGNEKKETLKHEINDLQALYYDMLENARAVLKTGGTMVFAKPRFWFEDGWLTIDWSRGLKDFGFEVEKLLPYDDMVLYAREGQLVGREIWKIRKV
jgi:tRNA G10  N-methylase Trm11